jgi:O-antigen/teichoic acid export membrane protein
MAPPEMPEIAPAAPTLAGAADEQVRRASSDAMLLTAATYGAQGLTFAAGLIQKAILGPFLTGYWALFQTFWTFFSIAPLGVQHGAARQIPMARGRNDLRGAAATANTSATFSFGAISLVGAVVVAVALVFGDRWSDTFRWGLVLLGVTAPLRYLGDMHEVIIQSVKRFDVQSKTVVVQAALALTVQTLAVWLLGFYGLYVGVVAMVLGSFALWVKLGAITPARPAFRFSIEREALRDVMRFGLPLMVYAQVWLLFQAVDSLIVAKALDVKQLGFYALAVSVTNYVMFMPKSIGAVLFPRMAERFAQTGTIESIHHYAADVQRLLAYLLVPIAVGGGFLFLPVLIQHGLPSFIPAIEVVQIMVAASYFMALMSMPIKVLMTAGYRWLLTSLLLLCLALNVVLNVGALTVLDLGLEGAAGATAISYFVTFAVTTGYSLSRTLSPSRVAVHLLEITAAFAYTYAALQVVLWLLGGPGDGVVTDTLTAAVQFGIFLALMLPAFALAQRAVGGLSLVRDATGAVLRSARRRAR